MPPGRLDHLVAFASRFVPPRNVDVWLPEGYPQPGKKYAVLYMHDGQNLFSPTTSYGGTEWQVDETITRLQQARQIEDCLVVGIWNTDQRFAEYTPAKPYQSLPAAYREHLLLEHIGVPVSDAYLRFVVDELKPHIAAHYATVPGRAHTFVSDSSMGGLISLYAALEYPTVFGGAACLSTHWPLSLQENTPAFTDAMLAYLAARLPRARHLRLYFDYGTATLDARYAAHKRRIDSLLTRFGYSPPRRITRRFEGAEHTERSWQLRFDLPARFLLGRTYPIRRQAGAARAVRCANSLDPCN